MPLYRRNIERYLSLALLLILSLATLAACQNGTGPTGNTVPDTHSPIVIGYTVPRTGDFSNDGPLLEQGYQLWADMVNKNGGLLGHQVQLKGLDDGSKPEQVTADYQRLISVDKANLLFAPFSGDLTVPAATVAHRFNYAMVEGAATEKGTFTHGLDNLFAVSLPAEHYITSFSNFILSLPKGMRPTTAAYVTSDDPFTQPQVLAARNLLEYNGLPGGVNTVVYNTYGAETQDFTSLAAQIVHSKADIVVLGTLGVQDLSAFMKYFRQQHYTPKALIAASGPDQGDAFLKAVGGNKVAEGVFVPNDGWYPNIATFQNDTFQQSYVAKHSGSANDISSDVVQGFSAAQVLQQAVEGTHSFDNGKIMAYLRNHTFKSLQGPVQFDAQGRNSIAVAFLFQWQNGKLIPVYPSNQAKANPEYPKQA